MKKILICSHWMEIGGAESALLGLLYNIDYSKYDVDLYLCRHSGEFMKYIPKEVNLLKEDDKAASIAIPIKNVIKKRYFDILFGRIYGKYKSFIYIKRNKIGTNCVAIENNNKYTYKFVAPINPNVTYDLLISFSEPHYIAAYKANAKKKVAWMHTDYSFVSVDVDEGYRIWNEFDAIAAISSDCQTAFLSTFPKLKDKLFLMENILCLNLLKAKAKENINFPKKNDEIILCSVGRYSPPKNFDNVPAICKYMVDNGYNVKWYIIGFGGEEELIKQKIAEANMQKNVILLGKKENPYPYMNACDIYVQPSRYEGKAVTVREAQTLAKPVVITNFPTSKSQLEDGVDGIIVPMDNEGCAKGIMSLIDDKELQQKLINNCKSRDYSNKQEIEKLYKIIEE